MEMPYSGTGLRKSIVQTGINTRSAFVSDLFALFAATFSAVLMVAVGHANAPSIMAASGLIAVTLGAWRNVPDPRLRSVITRYSLATACTNRPRHCGKERSQPRGGQLPER
ncbi:hypothetical protein ACWDYH_31505 [Nocardia goodfellowii]